MWPSSTLTKTIWTKQKSSKLSIVLQQLGNHGLLNNLFMVEVGGNDEDEVHTDVEIFITDNMKEGMERMDARRGENEQKTRRREFWDVRTPW
jgi:hypothetical protein